MDYLTKPISYLDINDFDDNGNIINPMILIGNKPIFIMLQANFCGFCKMAKPDFQKFAESTKRFFCATIQADSKNPDVVNLQPKMDKIYPNLVGFPSYIIFYQDKKIIYSGGRSFNDFQKFEEEFEEYLQSISVVVTK